MFHSASRLFLRWSVILCYMVICKAPLTGGYSVVFDQPSVDEPSA